MSPEPMPVFTARKFAAFTQLAIGKEQKHRNRKAGTPLGDDAVYARAGEPLRHAMAENFLFIFKAEFVIAKT